MIFALDTNTISFLLRPQYNQDVVDKWKEETRLDNAYVIPPVCYYETMWHLVRKGATAQNRTFQKIYQNSIKSAMIMTEADFQKAAEIKADFERRGIILGKNDFDILIAAYCIVNDYTLVTDNVSDFKRIDGVKFVNWKEY